MVYYGKLEFLYSTQPQHPSAAPGACSVQRALKAPQPVRAAPCGLLASVTLWPSKSQAEISMDL